jgi:nucleoside 2-deoxyribosyltransferase
MRRANGFAPSWRRVKLSNLVRRLLGKTTTVIWPYDLITQSEIDRLGTQAKFEIFSRCKSHLDTADMVIALLDGSQVDDGTSWEIGYFAPKGGPNGKLSVSGLISVERGECGRCSECDGGDGV